MKEVMIDEIQYEQKAQNYMVVTKNGNMIAQIMGGGMFGERNVVVIDNFGHTIGVADDGAVQDAIDRIVITGKLDS